MTGLRRDFQHRRPYHKTSTTEVFWDSEDKEERWMDFQMMLDVQPKQWPEALKNFLGVLVDEDGSDDSEDA